MSTIYRNLREACIRSKRTLFYCYSYSVVSVATLYSWILIFMQILFSHLMHQQQWMAFSLNGIFSEILTACNTAWLFHLFAVSSGRAIFIWPFHFVIGVIISVAIPINAQLLWRKGKNKQYFQVNKYPTYLSTVKTVATVPWDFLRWLKSKLELSE